MHPLFVLKRSRDLPSRWTASEWCYYLWAAPASLAREHGVNSTSQALGLEFNKLPITGVKHLKGGVEVDRAGISGGKEAVHGGYE